MSEQHYKEWEAEVLFDLMLDECYPMVTLFGQYHYDFSTVLQRVDPILYRQALLEYWEQIEQEAKEEKENA